MTTKNRISIIVLNYNGLRFLEKCLTSLERLNYPRDKYDIIVVDNASTDGSIAFLESNFSYIKLIKNKKNYGFCRGNNIGIEHCDTQYILLLNNDTHVHPDFLKNLVETMESGPAIGCCGGEEYNYDDHISHPIGRVRETSWMGAGATIYRKNALDQSGLFDPTFFFNCEDVDISWRIKLHNWKIFQNEAAIFYHAGKNKKITLHDKGLYYAWRNRIFLLIKYASIPQMLRSCFFYGSLLFKNKKMMITSPQQKNTALNKPLVQKRNNMLTLAPLKFYFILKIFFNVLIHTPEMLVKRYTLRKVITDQRKVDTWVQYVDAILRK